MTGQGLARRALWLYSVLTVAGCAIIARSDAALLQADSLCEQMGTAVRPFRSRQTLDKQRQALPSGLFLLALA